MANEIPPALLKVLADAEAKAHAGLELCAKGTACGFDMSGQEAVLVALRDRMQAVQQEFRPKGYKPT